MESPVYPRTLNTKGTDATVIGSGVIKNTVKVPHCSATLSDGLFKVYRSRMVALHAFRNTQPLSQLVS